jgi:anaerobic selenocysteine-containing dehydrogenase
VFREVMMRAAPARAHLVGLRDAAAIRKEIGRVVPLYKGIDALGAKGDQFQWGGRTLYADGRFATSDGKAHFAAVTPRAVMPDPDRFAVSTRRGKQFNSMIQRQIDPLTGAARDDIFISAADLARLQIDEGTIVQLRSARGTFRGRLKRAPIKAGNLEVHWPEGNTLLSGSAIDPESMEPDFNALVTIETIGADGGATEIANLQTVSRAGVESSGV